MSRCLEFSHRARFAKYSDSALFHKQKGSLKLFSPERIPPRRFLCSAFPFWREDLYPRSGFLGQWPGPDYLLPEPKDHSRHGEPPHGNQEHLWPLKATRMPPPQLNSLELLLDNMKVRQRYQRYHRFFQYLHGVQSRRRPPQNSFFSTPLPKLT